MHPVPLAAGERADLLLLVGPGEVEAGHVGTRVDRAATQHNLLLPARNFLPDRLVRVEGFAALVYISQLDRAAHRQLAGVGFLLVDDYPK